MCITERVFSMLSEVAVSSMRASLRIIYASGNRTPFGTYHTYQNCLNPAPNSWLPRGTFRNISIESGRPIGQFSIILDRGGSADWRKSIEMYRDS